MSVDSLQQEQQDVLNAGVKGTCRRNSWTAGAPSAQKKQQQLQRKKTPPQVAHYEGHKLRPPRQCCQPPANTPTMPRKSSQRTSFGPPVVQMLSNKSMTAKCLLASTKNRSPSSSVDSKKCQKQSTSAEASDDEVTFTQSAQTSSSAGKKWGQQKRLFDNRVDRNL